MPTAFDDLPDVAQASSPFDDLPDSSKGPFDDLPGVKPEAAPFQGLRQKGLESIGKTLQGVGTAAEEYLTTPAPTVLTPSREDYNKPLPAGHFIRGGVFLKDPTMTPLPAAEQMRQIQRNPLYVAGQSLADVAPETFPLTPAQEASKWTRGGEMVGGFVPALAGPLAPLAMGAQSIGDHISGDYERMKQAAIQNGISPETADELAAKGAIDKAFTSGAIQTGIFAVMPPVLRGALEKYLVDKFGKGLVSRWIAGRAAAGTEGAALGATSQAGENVAEGEPVLQGSGKAAEGLGLMNLLLPWLRGKPKPGATSTIEPPPQGTRETPTGTVRIEHNRPKTAPADVDQAVLDDLLGSLTKNQIEPKLPTPPEAPVNISGENHAEVKPSPLNQDAVKPEILNRAVEETPPKVAPEVMAAVPNSIIVRTPEGNRRVTVSARIDDQTGRAQMTAIKLHNDETGSYERFNVPSQARQFATLDEAGQAGFDLVRGKYPEVKAVAPAFEDLPEKPAVTEAVTDSEADLRGQLDQELASEPAEKPVTRKEQSEFQDELDRQQMAEQPEPVAATVKGELEAVPIEHIEAPEKEDLYAARQKKAEAWSELQQLREQIRKPGVAKAPLQVKLLRTELAHKDAILKERDALDAIEEKANEQGQTIGHRGLAREVRARMASGGNPQGEAGFFRLPAKEDFERIVGELPDQVQRVFQRAKDLRQRAVNRRQRSGLYDSMAAGFDSANTRAQNTGAQFGSVVLHSLNRAFGVKPRDVPHARDPLREQALTFAVEADGDRNELGRMKSALTGMEAEGGGQRLWKNRALKAIEFAEQNWDRLQPVAQLYKKITDAQIAYENAHGIKTLYRKGGYVFHSHNQDETFGVLSTGTAAEQEGAASPFLKQRQHDTYADSIAAGQQPLTLNGVDLMRQRSEMGHKLVNHGEWVDALKGVQDPATHLPLVTDPEIKTRADGMNYETAPAGYEIEDFGGRHFALNKGYTGLFGDLTSKSAFEKGPFREAAIRGWQAMKSTVLLGDSYHFGRLALWNAISRASAGGPDLARYKKGFLLLENSAGELQRMIDRGELREKYGKNLVESKQRLDALQRAGLNVGAMADNAHAEITQYIPVLGGFNKWLFGQYARGSMAEVALLEYAKQAKESPGLAPDVLARKVAKFVNTRFGNLGSQGFFKSKTFQDLARIAFLAPQWNESLIRSELGAVKEFAQAPGQSYKAGRLMLGPMARAVGLMTLAGFVGNQFINYATRGKPTWENEEEGFGSKISAWIPDVIGGGPGFFLNPAALPFEITHLLLNSAVKHGSWTAAVRDFTLGRLHPSAKGAYTFLTGKTPMQEAVKPGDWNLVKATAGQAMPVPISGGALYRGVKQMATGQHEEKYPGQFEKQILQSAGIKTEQAPDAMRRIQDLAVRFKQRNGLVSDATYDPPRTAELSAAVKRQNMADANEAIDALLQTRKQNGEPYTLRDIYDYYRHWAARPFTGSVRDEAKFKNELTPAQQQVYERARQQRIEVLKQVASLLRERIPTPASSLQPATN